MRTFSLAALALATALLSGTAAAQTTTLTVTPSTPYGWSVVDQDAGHLGTAAISSANPRDGNGSLSIFLPSDAAKVYYGTAIQPNTLESVSSIAFDWYRSSSSTVANHFAPAYHVSLYSNGVWAGDLVWERIYNEGAVSGNEAVPVDGWQTANIVNGQFWRSFGGPTGVDCAQQSSTNAAQKVGTISDWLTTCFAGQTVYVGGISVGGGSGWNGVFQGFVDNVEIGFVSVPGVAGRGLPNEVSTIYNFEADLATVPEPSSMALFATGLVGLAPIVRRRRSR
jgi:hypothetical protein